MSIIRTFQIEDAKLLQTSRTLHKQFEDRLTDFSTFDADFNATFANDWRAAIEAAEVHPTDETERDELQHRSSEVHRTLSIYLKKLDELEYYCHKAFDATDPDIILLFAFEQRSKALQSMSRFILWVMSMQNVYTAQLPQLTAAGMPAQLHTDLGAFFNTFLAAEIAQEEQKRLMKVSTRKRIAKLNAVFSFNQKVNRAAQVIYYSEPLKKALFKLEQ